MKPLSKLKQFLFLSVLASFLAGCATVSSNNLGIPESEWYQYSPEKRDELTRAYTETQERKKSMKTKAGEGVIAVEIQGGRMLLPPFTQLVSYEPITFTLRQGDCHKKIPVYASSNADQKGRLEVCYQEDTLYLDPSPYDPSLSLGALQFPYMPIWKRGFTYPNITSSGLLKLTNVNIKLKQVVSPENE